MPCDVLNIYDLNPDVFSGVCIDTNVTSTADAEYLKARDECCSVVTGNHIVVSDEGCWAYCNVTTKYEGIAVGTCNGNGLTLHGDVDTTGKSGYCLFEFLPDGEDIRSLIPSSILGTYAHPDPTTTGSEGDQAKSTSASAVDPVTTTSNLVLTSTAADISPTTTASATLGSTSTPVSQSSQPSSTLSSKGNTIHKSKTFLSIFVLLVCTSFVS